MKLVAILRIKNEKSIVNDCLTKMSELVDEIIILDNGSTDGTLDEYKKYKKIVKIIHTVGYDEGRDKCMLLEEAKKRNPDWLLFTDADEVFEKNLNRGIFDKYMNQEKYTKITFRMNHFWLSKEKFRIDSSFFLNTLHPIRILWKNNESGYFSKKRAHNGDIRGIKGGVFISPYRIKHYGYVDRDRVAEKYKRYNDLNTEKDRKFEHINPDSKFLTLRFVEFDNFYLNLSFIIVYKYVTNFLWMAYRVLNKIKMIIVR